MPLSVEEYKIGQLYMISKHSNEQSGDGEGVEVCANHPYEDTKHGKGQYTEKKIHLSSRLPHWIRSLIPKIFYVTEKAWNYYPHTTTEYTCSFVPKFIISIETCYEDNPGTNDNALGLDEERLASRQVDLVDISNDEISPKHYKVEEDLKHWRSTKTERGPLDGDWLKAENVKPPMMCSYKLVSVSFEVWGMQTRVEDFVHRAVREVLLVGHRQAVAWLDQWIEMTEQDVRKFEEQMHAATNDKISSSAKTTTDEVRSSSPSSTPVETPKEETETPTAKRGWFSWS